MKTTKILFTLAFTFLFCQLFAQKIKEIEPAILECQYKLTLKAPLNKNAGHLEDVMILRIGKNTSQFFSYYTYYSDSLWNDPIGNKIALRLTLEAVRTKDFSNAPSIRTTKEYIYKSYPEKEHTATYTSLGKQKSGSHSVYYTEASEPLQWEIKDSTKTILTYTARLATATFRGRTYQAWFTNEIPLNNGPWKFHGLPGLILEVNDTQNEYHYSIISIRQQNLLPVSFYNFWGKDYEKTERKTFLKKERSLRNDPEGETIDFLERDYQ